MATASELTPRVERLEEKHEALERNFNNYRVENARELTKIAERQTNTFTSVQGIEKKLERMDIKLDEVEKVPNANKAKWYDEVLKYVVLALLGYIALKLGLK